MLFIAPLLWLLTAAGIFLAATVVSLVSVAVRNAMARSSAEKKGFILRCTVCPVTYDI